MPEHSHTAHPRTRPPQGTMGTFSGVFTPSFLTIIGIIFFLRLGYVVGNAGLWRALMIIAVANAISVLTSISLTAVATNIRVKVGGVYYIISRTLGAEFGGAIGIVLFLAQSISIAFYCIGFGEAVAALMPNSPSYLPQAIAALSVAILFVLAWLGADWATKFQFVVMGILFLAIASFFGGAFLKWNTALLADNWQAPSAGPGFWVIFAIFFPAVTGFTQGVNMSGDLRDPGTSIPRGTALAVGLTMLIYFGGAVVFAASLTSDTLTGTYDAMKQVSLVNVLVDAGVIAATLSSAMASFLGGPRVLQSLAADRTFPFLVPFAKGHGPASNPRRGVVLSCVIAFASIGFGNLNVIAPVVSMFFLVSYGLLNYATYFEARSASPSFRPRFRWFDRRLSLVGWIACLGTMLAINLTAGIVALAIVIAVYQYLKRTAGPARWADSRRSFHLQHLREHLIAAYREPEHPRDWRPQLIAFSDDTHRRERLLTFASWLEAGSGVTTAVRILAGEGIKALKLRREAEAELRRDIEEHGYKAFPLVVVAPNIDLGVYTILQAFGVGPLRVNTILLNWMEQMSRGMPGIRELRYGRNLRTAFRLGCNIVILYTTERSWDTLTAAADKQRRIDIWWHDDATSRLMLLLAFLMTRNEHWEDARIRILASSTHDGARTSENLEQMLEDVRIEADVTALARPSSDDIINHSADADLVCIPFRLVGTQIINPFGEKMEEVLPRLSVAALVLAAEDIDLTAEPEEGIAGELALALDALAELTKKAREAEKEADEAAAAVEEQMHELHSAVARGAAAEEIEKIRIAVQKAMDTATKAARKAAKALVKAEDAARAADERKGELDQ